MVAGEGFEPHDLRVMSPTSYQLLHPAIYKLYAVYYKIYLGRLQHFSCWCRKPGLNRYATHVARDFKSRASANSAIPAERPSSEHAYYITPRRLCQPPFSNLPLNVHRKAALPIRRASDTVRCICIYAHHIVKYARHTFADTARISDTARCLSRDERRTGKYAVVYHRPHYFRQLPILCAAAYKFRRRHLRSDGRRCSTAPKYGGSGDYFLFPQT